MKRVMECPQNVHFIIMECPRSGQSAYIFNFWRETQNMIIKPDNEMLSYSGRIDFDDRLAPVLVYACSSIGMKFAGTSLKAVIANHRSCWTNELGYFIDGEQKRFTLSSDEEKKTYTLAEGLSEGTHELLLFKRMDSCHTFTF